MDDDIRDGLLDGGFERATNMEDIKETVEKLKQDEDIVLSKKNKRKVSAPYPYVAVGNGRAFDKNKEKSIDLFEAIIDMNVHERRALSILKNHLFDTNNDYGIIRIVMGDWKKKEKDNWQNGIAALIDKDYVRRVKKGYYIINPRLIVPTGDKTVHNGLSNDEKAKRHDKYISNVMSNWKNAQTITP